MIRFVVAPDGRVVPDLAARLPGRGMWLSAKAAVLEDRRLGPAFARAAKAHVTLPDDLPTMLVAYPLWRANPLLAVLVGVVGWVLRYHVGYLIQQHFTTKPPTPEQLRAGIEAGRKLLYYWGSNPERVVPPALNLWIRGMPQLIAGVIVGQQVLGFVQQHLHVWLDW